MKIKVPFLIFRGGEIEPAEEMELASAFLYFDSSRSESIKNIFSKHNKETVTCIAKGLYPLKARLLDGNEKLYCIYDGLGLNNDSIEIDIKQKFDIHMDSSITSLGIREKIAAVRNLSGEISKKEKVRIHIGNLITGFKNIEGILRGKEAQESGDWGTSLEGSREGADMDVSAVSTIISDFQSSVELEIQLLKDLCALDDDNFKNSITERNKIYEEFKDKIYETDKEVSGNIARLIIEREDKIREIDKLYSDKIACLEQDYIFNKNRYDISKIYGNEIEMNIYERSMSDAEDKIEQLKKEAGDEIKNIEKHYDSLLEEEKKKIKEAINDRDKMVKECESLHNELHSTIDLTKKNISDDIFEKRNLADTMRSWSGKYECQENVIDIFVPFYFAEYSGSEIRYKLFIPQMLEEKKQIASLISGITGKVPLPFSERDGFFEALLKGFREWLKSEESRVVVEFLKGNNLIAKEGMELRVEEGLKSLAGAGYLSDKNYEKALNGIKAMFVQ